MISKAMFLVGPLALAFALPSAAAEQTRTRHKIVVAKPGTGRSYLGIGVAEIDAARAKALNLTEERGVEVKNVEEDSPADKAGLKEGDVVLQYNGQPVEGTEQFMRMVKETPVGRTVKLLVSRGGSSQTLAATIGRRSARMPNEEFFGEDAEKFEFEMPEMPEIHIPEIHVPEIHIPDMPTSNFSWRSSVLGVESESLGPQLAAYFGVKQGVLVRSVNKGSAAEKAGFKAGDVIVKVDGTAVASPREITSLLKSKSKTTVPVTLVRNHKELVVSVIVEETPRGDREKAAADSEAEQS
jgi:serine protease Do